MLAVLGIAGFVLQLTFLHERNADAEEKHRDGNRSQDKPIVASEHRVHQPDAPPEQDFAKVVGMPTVLPQSHIAILSRVTCAEIMNLFVGNQLNRSGGDAYQKGKNPTNSGNYATTASHTA